MQFLQKFDHKEVDYKTKQKDKQKQASFAKKERKKRKGKNVVYGTFSWH